MKIELFYKEIKERAGGASFEAYRRLLAALNEVMRERLIITLRRGFDLPRAYELLYMGRHFPEKNYQRFLGWAEGKWLSQAGSELRNEAVKWEPGMA